MNITPEEIARLRALEAKATPGPWVVQSGCSWRRIGTMDADGNVLCPSNDRDGHPNLNASEVDLDAIVAARNALPALLDEIERLRAEAANWHNLRTIYADAQRECAELRAYKERTEAALREFCRFLEDVVETDGESVVSDLRQLGLWREGGA